MRLEHDALLAIEWFENNYIKVSKEKCHFLVFGHKYENVWDEMGEKKMCYTKTTWNEILILMIKCHQYVRKQEER